MLITIVVPLYNKRDSVLVALNSILAQTHSDFELLVVDDGSTDNSLLAVQSWIYSLSAGFSGKVKLLHKANGGVSSARNYGVKHASADFIAFLDADDYWYEDHLARLVFLIEKFGSEVDIFSSFCVQVLGGETVYPKLGGLTDFCGVIDYFNSALISNGFVNSSSVCVRKDSIVEFRFPETMKTFEDVVTWARISADKGFAFSSEPSAVYVLDDVSGSMQMHYESYLEFERIILNEVAIKKVKKYNFYMRIMLLRLMFVRMNIGFISYCKLWAGFRCMGIYFKIIFIIVSVLPSFVIRFARKFRKK